jgi:hypothetical protein
MLLRILVTIFLFSVHVILSPGRAAAQDGLRDVKAPLDYPHSSWLLILLAVIIPGLVAVAVFLKRRTSLPAKVKPALLPWQKALIQLMELEKQDFLSKEDYNGFYSELSDILRRYIEEQFAIRAPEMTTEEFLQFLRKSSALNPQQKEALGRFMESADLVKFAKYTPDASEALQGFQLAKKFIEETKPQVSDRAPHDF